ncbi:MAG: tetratricopeptide repeat protein, partial [Candidatus Methanofastidiosia archaeon]
SRALEINPKNEDAWNNKGDSLYEMEKYEEALECYSRALEINPKNEDAWNNKGNSLYKMEKYQEALECHKRALEINPKNEDAWIYKGNSLDELEENEEALECYDKALGLNPTNIETWINKGNILYKMGRHEEALESYDRALEINPKDENALSNKSLSLDEMGKYQEALECYNRAIEINPGNLIFRINRNLVQKRLEILEKREENVEEESSEIDWRREVLNELGDDVEKILESKELTQRRLDSFLQPGESPDNGNFFLVLRRWNSYTPALHTFAESNPGGGYFLHWKGKGIVIDPGFDFLDNFFENGLHIADIDAVIITHAHVDHCSDFESILTLIYEYNDKNKDKGKGGKKEIDVFMNLGAMRKFLCWVPTEPGEKSFINRVHSLEYGNSYDLKDYGLTLKVTRAVHDEVLSKSCSVGLIFELYDEEEHTRDSPLRIGYTSDTGHFESVEEQYRGVEMIIAHLGSIEKADFDPEEKDEPRNHLMLRGVMSVIDKSGARLALISEFGEELGESRIKIVDALDNIFRGKRRTKCLAGDIGLRVSIPELKIRCKNCGEDKDMDQILERIDARDKKNSSIVYLCDHCINGNSCLKENSAGSQ